MQLCGSLYHQVKPLYPPFSWGEIQESYRYWKYYDRKECVDVMSSDRIPEPSAIVTSKDLETDDRSPAAEEPIQINKKTCSATKCFLQFAYSRLHTIITKTYFSYTRGHSTKKVQKVVSTPVHKCILLLWEYLSLAERPRIIGI